ncbi:hypothetical protein NCPPB3778_67 [Rathayibacter phage NCPPB3778]|nr:hypothetical protein NCPPB3778_67 [Rathayibacter phage NCPPB3778]
MPTEPSIHDAAEYILEVLGESSALRLEFLLFFCQALHVSCEGEPLFAEEFLALSPGPICPETFRVHRGRYLPEGWTSGDPDVLSDEAVESIDAVLDTFGEMTTAELGARARGTFAWLNARSLSSFNHGLSQPIALEDMIMSEAVEED